MKTSIANVYGKKMFIVNTEIKKDSYRPGITNLKVMDEKKVNEVFRMNIDLEAQEGMISDFGMTVNGVDADGNLVALINMDTEDTVEDVKKAFGAKLVACQEHLTALAAQMANEAAAVDAIFEGIAE